MRSGLSASSYPCLVSFEIFFDRVYPTFWRLSVQAQAHLLPLQQYILEQAKLSGYRFGDSLGDAEDASASGPSGSVATGSSTIASDGPFTSIYKKKVALSWSLHPNI